MINQNEQKSKKLAKRKKGTIKASVNFFRTARYGLTLQEHRLVYYALLVGQQNNTPFAPVTITIEEFRELFKLTKSNSTYGDVRRASKNVLTKVVEVMYKDGDGMHLKQAQWLSDVTYHAKQGTVTITPNTALQPFFEGKQYTETEFYFLVKFTSQYAERLYELIKSTYQPAKPLIDFDIADLRAKLAIGKKYPNYTDLKSRVLIPALDDINEYTDLDVTIHEKRGLRNKVEIVFFAVKIKEVERCALRDANGDFARQQEYKPPLTEDQQETFIADLFDEQISFEELEEDSDG